jgi:hypothetical protein
MKLKFIIDDGKYKAGRIYLLSKREAFKFLVDKKAVVYVDKPEKAIIK